MLRVKLRVTTRMKKKFAKLNVVSNGFVSWFFPTIADLFGFNLEKTLTDDLRASN